MVVTRFIAAIAMFLALVAGITSWVEHERYVGMKEKTRVQADRLRDTDEALAQMMTLADSQNEINAALIQGQRTTNRVIKKLLDDNTDASRSLAGSYP